MSDKHEGTAGITQAMAEGALKAALFNKTLAKVKTMISGGEITIAEAAAMVESEFAQIDAWAWGYPVPGEEVKLD